MARRLIQLSPESGATALGSVMPFDYQTDALRKHSTHLEIRRVRINASPFDRPSYRHFTVHAKLHANAWRCHSAVNHRKHFQRDLS
jgi:hypothetical protein